MVTFCFVNLSQDLVGPVESSFEDAYYMHTVSCVKWIKVDFLMRCKTEHSVCPSSQ